jgi:hypothetical protein
MPGAVSGIAPFKNAPTCGRKLSPYGFAFPGKIKTPGNAKSRSNLHGAQNFESSLIMANPHKILGRARAVKFLSKNCSHALSFESSLRLCFVRALTSMKAK